MCVRDNAPGKWWFRGSSQCSPIEVRPIPRRSWRQGEVWGGPGQEGLGRGVRAVSVPATLTPTPSPLWSQEMESQGF